MLHSVIEKGALICFSVSWATSKVENLLRSKPDKYNEFWSDEAVGEKVAAGKQWANDLCVLQGPDLLLI